jgi:hypothetical protein
MDYEEGGVSLRNKQEEIKAKGFNIVTSRDTNLNQQTGYQGVPYIDFNKIKVGAKTLDDAILKLGDLKNINPRLTDKETVLRAINNYDLPTMREVSDLFYRISGIYSRLIKYMAFMYRYD